MPMPADSMQHMSHDMDTARDFLMRESSGTGFQPSAWPMPMVMTSVGQWRLMWMAQAFLVDTQQTGPLGADKFYSTNWGMLGAVHRIGGGNVMLRTMLSLEPATVSGEFYPLLFQTGETAYGKPIVNGQHPHDFVMELSVQYAHTARFSTRFGTFTTRQSVIRRWVRWPIRIVRRRWRFRRARSGIIGKIRRTSCTTWSRRACRTRRCGWRRLAFTAPSLTRIAGTSTLVR